MYSIGYACSYVGLCPETVRRYESQGLITPQRTTSGQRLYTPADLKKLRDIKAGKVAGRPRKAA